MRIALVFPPFDEIRRPPVALVETARSLRAAGHAVLALDANVGFIDARLSPVVLRRLAPGLRARFAALERKVRLSADDAATYRSLSAVVPLLDEIHRRLPEAKRALREPETYRAATEDDLRALGARLTCVRLARDAVLADVPVLTWSRGDARAVATAAGHGRSGPLEDRLRDEILRAGVEFGADLLVIIAAGRQQIVPSLQLAIAARRAIRPMRSLLAVDAVPEDLSASALEPLAGSVDAVTTVGALRDDPSLVGAAVPAGRGLAVLVSNRARGGIPPRATPGVTGLEGLPLGSYLGAAIELPVWIPPEMADPDAVADFAAASAEVLVSGWNAECVSFTGAALDAVVVAAVARALRRRPSRAGRPRLAWCARLSSRGAIDEIDLDILADAGLVGLELEGPGDPAVRRPEHPRVAIVERGPRPLVPPPLLPSLPACDWPPPVVPAGKTGRAPAWPSLGHADRVQLAAAGAAVRAVRPVEGRPPAPETRFEPLPDVISVWLAHDPEPLGGGVGIGRTAREQIGGGMSARRRTRVDVDLARGLCHRLPVAAARLLDAADGRRSVRALAEAAGGRPETVEHVRRAGEILRDLEAAGLVRRVAS
jgi:hypothetical protein